MSRVAFPRLFAAAMLFLVWSVCRAQPASGAARRDAALALEQQGDIPAADAAWHALLRAHPGNAEACAHIGFLESRQQHYSEAVRYYREAAARDPSIPGLRMNLGLSLFKAGDIREAAGVFVPLYRQAAPDSPEGQRLRLLIGLADYGAGEYGAAVPWLRKAMAADPQNLPYRLVLAHSCLWSKQYQCVLDVYHQILNLNGESAEADMLAGEAYDEMRDHQDAIEQFKNAVKADPHVPGVHFGLGCLLWRQNQFEEAAQQFQLESANAPGEAEALAYWADSATRLSQPEARTLVERALKLDSREELPWLDLGILDAGAGGNRDALRDFQEAKRLAPSDVQVHWGLARLYQTMGRRAEAQAEFNKTKSLTKAADKTVMEKLHANRPAEAAGQAVGRTVDPQPSASRSR